MESSKRCKSERETFVLCTICGNHKNCANVYHRKSEEHVKNLGKKLNKISHYMSLKKKCTSFVVHDEQWPQKDYKRYCHFCRDTYLEHHAEDEFVIETLGYLLHHADPQHIQLVKTFLKENGRKDNFEKFCVKKSKLDSVAIQLSEAKSRYLKKMELLNEMAVKEIKDVEAARLKLVNETIQAPSVAHTHEFQDLMPAKQNAEKSAPYLKKNNSKFAETEKIPPWLIDDSPGISSDQQSHKIVIGPTMESYLKHVDKEKKKGLPAKRIGANFKRNDKKSSKWLPSFHGVWNQGRRWKPK